MTSAGLESGVGSSDYQAFAQERRPSAERRRRAWAHDLLVREPDTI
jgi:hypothetical protein